MSLQSDLLAWYDENAGIRALPWRGEKDPYRIWLSEIMLQQTQAETVKRYYARFLERCPDVFALADAPEEEVLKLWEGLGYYSRARNLHAAAGIVARKLNGRFPGNAEALKKLPGIGPYAAAAISSIAYGEPAPALDGNQARVLSRLLAWEDELRTPFDLLPPALDLISHERPGDYNQALMDLGASVCTPKAPACELCPIKAHCKAFLEDAALEFPRKPAPVPKREEDWSVVLMLINGKLLVKRRPKGLLGGLYEFCAVGGHHCKEGLMEALSDLGFTKPTVIKRLPPARHIFTHKIWRMEGWLCVCEDAPEGYLPTDGDAMTRLPFPSALRVYREIAGEVLENH